MYQTELQHWKHKKLQGNETKKNETKKNETNETNKTNETKKNETKKNETKKNETNTLGLSDLSDLSKITPKAPSENLWILSFAMVGGILIAKYIF